MGGVGQVSTVCRRQYNHRGLAIVRAHLLETCELPRITCHIDKHPPIGSFPKTQRHKVTKYANSQINDVIFVQSSRGNKRESWHAFPHFPPMESVTPVRAKILRCHQVQSKRARMACLDHDQCQGKVVIKTTLVNTCLTVIYFTKTRIF